ncbi:MAG TPA: hypothetical protein VGO00_01090 [Kofleriaceae bacterium]|nr:hypothetical protein [Kofleriaceae bacterium]
MGKLLFLAVLAGACGRFGFASEQPPGSTTPDAPDDTTPPADGPPGSTPYLTCGTPARFTVAANPSTLSAITTSQGYDVLEVDAAGNVTGWTYAFSGSTGKLEPVATGVALATNATGPMGGAGTGANIICAGEYGRPSATGTSTGQLDDHLQPVGTPTLRDGSFINQGPIAQSAASGNYGLLVASGANLVTGHVLTTAGGDTGTTNDVIPAADGASFVALTSGGAGYIATWTTSSTSPNAVRMAVLDDDLKIVKGPITTASPNDALGPQVAWAKNANVYLLIWYEKNATNGDDIYYEIRDADLALVGTQVHARGGSYAATLASDGDGFVVAWDNYVPADHMEAVYVDATGATTGRTVANTGGKPTQWMMTVRLGQPALVWLEDAGIGPNLYVDPVCN